MLERLEKLEKEYEGLEAKLMDPEVITNHQEYQRVAKQHAKLRATVQIYRAYKRVLKDIESTQQLIFTESDEELLKIARQELQDLGAQKTKLQGQLQARFTPKEATEDRNTIMEIRAGTGGEEAALFAADLFRMYSKYAEKQGYKIEVINSNPTGIGGFKEIIFIVTGKGAYNNLKYEGGVHRVQRVPITESSGRIHTSAATVAVLPEAQLVDLELDPADLKIETFRASAPGGQHVQKTESAVRVTHLPTGLSASCQDSRSQHQNKERALTLLRSRLLQQLQSEKQAQLEEQRKEQVRTGDRSDKIRTYNFPQNRVTDHRISLTLYKLPEILNGDLTQLINAVKSNLNQKTPPGE